MEDIPFRLTDSEKRRLDRSYANTGKSAAIGKRAVEIVRLYFQKTHRGCTFIEPTKGADLHPVWSSGEAELEVKGTDSEDIAWSKLKVSSRHSFELLKKGLPLYRVTCVFSETPTLHILKSGVDFKMTGEDRWSVQGLTPKPNTPALKVKRQKQRK